MKKLFVFMAMLLLLAGLFAGCTKKPEVQEVNADVGEIFEEDVRIHDGIFVNEVAVGGLTKEEAVEKLKQEIVEPANDLRLILKKDDETSWVLDYKDIDYSYNVDLAVSIAYNYSRTGSEEEIIKIIEDLKTTPYTVKLFPTYDAAKVDGFLEKVAEESRVEPVEPSLSRVDGNLVAGVGVDGSALNAEATKELMRAYVDYAKSGEVAVVMDIVPPKFSDSTDLSAANSLLGSFSTPITGSAERDVNLTVATNYVNGTTILPGEVFSTNGTIGQTTYERGYRNAPVIVNGKLEDGLGGGVCQVSSTLYNAVLFAELEVVQRQNHSLVVGYCPIGRDATLAGTVIDFKFKNNTDMPIYIEGYLSGKKLFINIYGHETRPANRTLSFDSVYIKTSPAPVVDVYKNVMVNGSVVERIYVDRSTYRPPADSSTSAAPPASTPTPAATPVSTPKPASQPAATPAAPKPEAAPPISEPAPTPKPEPTPEPAPEPTPVPEPVPEPTPEPFNPDTSPPALVPIESSSDVIPATDE